MNAVPHFTPVTLPQFTGVPSDDDDATSNCTQVASIESFHNFLCPGVLTHLHKADSTRIIIPLSIPSLILFCAFSRSTPFRSCCGLEGKRGMQMWCGKMDSETFPCFWKTFLWLVAFIV